MKYQLKKLCKRMLIGLIIIGVFNTICFIPKLILKEEITHDFLIAFCIVIGGFELLCYGVNFIPEILQVLEWKKIEKNCIKVKGKVVGCYRDMNKHSLHVEQNDINCYLMIEYFSPITNKIENFIEEKFDFDPITYLGSKECTVCINKASGLLYGVTDFKKRKRGEEKIWTKEQIKDYKTSGHMKY